MNKTKLDLENGMIGGAAGAPSLRRKSRFRFHDLARRIEGLGLRFHDLGFRIVVGYGLQFGVLV